MLLAFALSAGIADPPIVLEGKGSRSLVGPFWLSEGKAVVRILHRTPKTNTYFSAWMAQDWNHDGKWDAATEYFTIAVHRCGYEAASELDVRKEVHVDASAPTYLSVEAAGIWKVVIESKPSPVHVIEGSVLDGSGSRVPGASIAAVDGEGRSVSGVTNRFGCFSLSVYGARTYRVIAWKGADAAETQGVLMAGRQPFLRSLELRLAERQLADLSLMLDAPPGTAVEGEEIRHTFILENHGPTPTRVLVRLEVRGLASERAILGVAGCGADFTSIHASRGRPDRMVFAGQPATGRYLWDVGPLAPNERATLWLRTKARSSGKLEVKATAFGFRVDPSPFDNEVRHVVLSSLGEVFGRVATLDPQGRAIVLTDIPVELREDGAARVVRTDREGTYRFTDVRAREISLEVWLRSPTITVDPPLEGRLIPIRTIPRKRTAARQREDLWLTGSHPTFGRILKFGTPEAQRNRIHDAAYHFHLMSLAAAFARSALRLELDHQLPVRVWICENLVVALGHYQPLASIISIASRVSSLRTANGMVDAHEFGHHVHCDSRMGGENRMPDLSPGDRNHGGTLNSDSSDSFTEGFANFFAALVGGNRVLTWPDGGTTDLEANWWGGGTGEANGVAGLLWDLVDPVDPRDRDAKLGCSDTFCLPLAAVWDAINRPEIRTVRSLYLALEDAGIGLKDTDGNGRRDLDDLFILHYFWQEKNSNRTPDADEPVGYAGVFVEKKDRNRPPRHSPPHLPGARMKFTAVDTAGQAVSSIRFRLEVRFPEGENYFDYAHWAWIDESGSEMSVYVPKNADRVEIVPVAPGYRGKILAIPSAEFWTAVGRAAADGRETFRVHEFVLETNAVPAPGDFTATKEPDGRIRLRWTVDPEADGVILVRRADRPASTPAEGTVILEGWATEFADAAPWSGCGSHYSLFAVRRGEWSVPVTAGIEADFAAADRGVDPQAVRPPSPPAVFQPIQSFPWITVGLVWFFLLGTWVWIRSRE